MARYDALKRLLNPEIRRSGTVGSAHTRKGSQPPLTPINKRWVSRGLALWQGLGQRPKVLPTDLIGDKGKSSEVVLLLSVIQNNRVSCPVPDLFCCVKNLKEYVFFYAGFIVRRH